MTDKGPASHRPNIAKLSWQPGLSDYWVIVFADDAMATHSKASWRSADFPCRWT
jgi:hypothetical protein